MDGKKELSEFQSLEKGVQRRSASIVLVEETTICAVADFNIYQTWQYRTVAHPNVQANYNKVMKWHPKTIQPTSSQLKATLFSKWNIILTV